MEMRAHHPSKRGSMEEEEDRLSSLPDDVLHSILLDLPLKHAVRTSALSRRWAPQWLRALASSRVLDFTDPDMARGQPPARVAATVRRCLELHAEHGTPLDVFRVALRSPPAGSSDGAFGRDVVGWMASAVARGAREVEVKVDLTPPKPAPTPTPTLTDSLARLAHGGFSHVPAAPTGLTGLPSLSLSHVVFTGVSVMVEGEVVDLTPPPPPKEDVAEFVELPGDLFVARNSLARLALGGFSLRAVPAAPTGLAGLCSLSLSHADFTGEAFRDVVSSCWALEHLCLSSCNLLKSIRIASETLRVLEIVRFPEVEELRVTAPALESIAFHDVTLYWVRKVVNDLFPYEEYEEVNPVDLGSMPALRDAYLSEIGFDANHQNDYDFADLLSLVAHAPVLTLSSDLGVWYLDTVDMTNIQELQLLIASLGDLLYDDEHQEGRQGVVRFFQNKENQLPLLDRLFVRFPSHVTDDDCDNAKADADAAAALAGEVIDDSELEIHTEFVLDRLSFIKLVNFRGTRFELQLLAFVLKRAPALEQLVLATVGEEGGASGPGDEHLEIIQRQVSAMRKASPHACLTVCRLSEDRSQNPVHTKFYHEFEE